MKLLPSLLLAAVALTACSGTTVIESVSSTSQVGAEFAAASAGDEAEGLDTSSAEPVLAVDENTATETDDVVDAGAPAGGTSDLPTPPATQGPDAEAVETPVDHVDPATTEPTPGDVSYTHDAPDPETDTPADAAGAATSAAESAGSQVPAADGNQVSSPVPVDWCAAPAEEIRVAFAETIFADRPGGKTLEQALGTLLQTLIELKPIAPAELQGTFTIAIETQIELNALLDAVAWDKSAIDWSTAAGIAENQRSTHEIDAYGAETCGIRSGFSFPMDGAPGNRVENDEFEDLIGQLVEQHGLDRYEARCLAEVFFEYRGEASIEIAEEINACGVSAEKLAEIAAG